MRAEAVAQKGELRFDDPFHPAPAHSVTLASGGRAGVIAHPRSDRLRAALESGEQMRIDLDAERLPQEEESGQDVDSDAELIGDLGQALKPSVRRRQYVMKIHCPCAMAHFAFSPQAV